MLSTQNPMEEQSLLEVARRQMRRHGGQELAETLSSMIHAPGLMKGPERPSVGCLLSGGQTTLPAGKRFGFKMGQSESVHRFQSHDETFPMCGGLAEITEVFSKTPHV